VPEIIAAQEPDVAKAIVTGARGPGSTVRAALPEEDAAVAWHGFTRAKNA